MIIAVPEQETVMVQGIGSPPHQSVLTWYRFYCTECRWLCDFTSSSHADGALDQGDYHVAVEQCHAVGQLSLFDLAGAS